VFSSLLALPSTQTGTADVVARGITLRRLGNWDRSTLGQVVLHSHLEADPSWAMKQLKAVLWLTLLWAVSAARGLSRLLWRWAIQPSRPIVRLFLGLLGSVLVAVLESILQWEKQAACDFIILGIKLDRLIRKLGQSTSRHVQGLWPSHSYNLIARFPTFLLHVGIITIIFCLLKILSPFASFPTVLAPAQTRVLMGPTHPLLPPPPLHTPFKTTDVCLAEVCSLHTLLSHERLTSHAFSSTLYDILGLPNRATPENHHPSSGPPRHHHNTNKNNNPVNPEAPDTSTPPSPPQNIYRLAADARHPLLCRGDRRGQCMALLYRAALLLQDETTRGFYDTVFLREMERVWDADIGPEEAVDRWRRLEDLCEGAGLVVGIETCYGYGWGMRMMGNREAGG